MTRPVDPKRLGPPLDLSTEHLDQIAEVTPVDVALAKALWQGHAPSRLMDLLDAEPTNGGQTDVVVKGL